MGRNEAPDAQAPRPADPSRALPDERVPADALPLEPAPSETQPLQALPVEPAPPVPPVDPRQSAVDELVAALEHRRIWTDPATGVNAYSTPPPTPPQPGEGVASAAAAIGASLALLPLGIVAVPNVARRDYAKEMATYQAGLARSYARGVYLLQQQAQGQEAGQAALDELARGVENESCSRRGRRRRLNAGAVAGGAGAVVLGLIYLLLRVTRVLGQHGESRLVFLLFLGLVVACVIGGVVAVIVQGHRRWQRTRDLRAAQFAGTQCGPPPVASPAIPDEADASAGPASAADAHRGHRGPLRT